MWIFNCAGVRTPNPNLFKGKLHINAIFDCNIQNWILYYFIQWPGHFLGHLASRTGSTYCAQCANGPRCSLLPGSKDIYWINPPYMRGHMGIFTYTPQTGFAAIFLGKKISLILWWWPTHGGRAITF